MKQTRIGITTGDLNGIGLEVVIKTLAEERVLKHLTPVIYGSAKAVIHHRNATQVGNFHFHTIQDAREAADGKVNVVECWQEAPNIQFGQMNAEGGKYAYISLDRAARDLKDGAIDALVTAPIHKQAMGLAGFPEVGHTEFLGKLFGTADPLMMLVSDSLRVGVVTGHVPLAEVSALLTKARIIEKVKTMHQSLRVDFGIERPVIAVLGLNPHAGDGGLIGKEDQELIQPAIVECKKSGFLATGPHPADGFFGSGAFAKADGILAMYHDQGLIPFKALSFGRGVNYTAGLPKVRTSPDHGVAFDLAGKGVADPSSFREALFMALDITRQRRQHAEWHANPLQSRDTFRKGEDEKIAE